MTLTTKQQVDKAVALLKPQPAWLASCRQNVEWALQRIEEARWAADHVALKKVAWQRIEQLRKRVQEDPLCHETRRALECERLSIARAVAIDHAVAPGIGWDPKTHAYFAPIYEKLSDKKLVAYAEELSGVRLLTAKPSEYALPVPRVPVGKLTGQLAVMLMRLCNHTPTGGKNGKCLKLARILYGNTEAKADLFRHVIAAVKQWRQLVGSTLRDWPRLK
jgi:hypothetical protein